MPKKISAPPLKIIQDENEPVAVEILADSILQISVAAKKLLNSGLTMRAIVLLIQDLAQTGRRKISRDMIELVLENLPRLEEYVQKNK